MRLAAWHSREQSQCAQAEPLPLYSAWHLGGGYGVPRIVVYYSLSITIEHIRHQREPRNVSRNMVGEDLNRSTFTTNFKIIEPNHNNVNNSILLLSCRLMCSQQDNRARLSVPVFWMEPYPLTNRDLYGS